MTIDSISNKANVISASADPIPTVHIEDLRPSELRAAFASVGAIRLEGAFVALDWRALQFAAAEAFALSEDVRNSYRRRGTDGGYTPPGVEGVRGQRGECLREFWDLLPTDIVQARLPDQAPRFGDAMTATLGSLSALAGYLLRGVDATRPQQVPRLAELAAGGRHLLRTNRYAPTDRDAIVFPSHVDFGLLTLYVGGSGRGLQFMHEDRWHDLENPSGCVVAACGTTLRMYEPSFRPLRHRVLATGEERYSTVFFTEPRGDVVLPNGNTAAAHHERLVDGIRRE